MNVLILADDLTGSIDTGVTLARIGVSTHIITDPNTSFTAEPAGSNVFVVDTETRHLSPQKAADVISQVLEKAEQFNFEIIYKKTDSALRGNIGAELGAMAKTCGGTVHFAPSYPKLNRLTIDGFHYINGQPVRESAFGRDPFEPVRSDSVAEIIGEQDDIPVRVIKESSVFPIPENENQILVYDATTDVRLDALAAHLFRYTSSGRLLMAGCAAFASHLGRFLERASDIESLWIPGSGELLAVSGSMNPITLQQIAAARSNGFAYCPLLHELTAEDDGQFCRLADSILTMCAENRRVIVEIGGEDHLPLPGKDAVGNGLALARGGGRLIRKIFDNGFSGTISVTGGDTLRGIMDAVDIRDIQPVYEIEPGVVYAIVEINGQKRGMITKSGGFGSRNAFLHICDFLKKHPASKSLS